MAEEHGGSHGGGGEHEHKKHKKHGGHGGHGGGHEEHEEGVPEWVVSFADNALLQMGFFVILLAMNLKPQSSGAGGAPVDNREGGVGVPIANAALVDSAIAIREAFNNPVNLASSSPNDIPLIRRIIQRREGTAFEDGPAGDKQNVQSVRPTDYYRTGGLVNFEANSAEVDGAGQAVIAQLAKQYKGRKTIIEVRGHTSIGESFVPEDKGMRLSFDRAMAVFQRLAEAGLDPAQMRVVSVGSGDGASPIARDDPARRNNQRVEIIITDEHVPDDPYAVDPAAAPPAPRAPGARGAWGAPSPRRAERRSRRTTRSHPGVITDGRPLTSARSGAPVRRSTCGCSSGARAGSCWPARRCHAGGAVRPAPRRSCALRP